MFVFDFPGAPNISGNVANGRIMSDLMIVLTYSKDSSWVEITVVEANQKLHIKRNVIHKQRYPGKSYEVQGLNEENIDSFVQKYQARGMERELGKDFGTNRWLFLAEMLNAGMSNKLNLSKITATWSKAVFIGNLTKFVNTASPTIVPALIGNFSPSKATTTDGVTDNSPGAAYTGEPVPQPIIQSPTAAVSVGAG